MSGLGNLVIDLVNGYGERIDDVVDISVRHTVLHDGNRDISKYHFKQPISLSNMPAGDGSYLVTITPKRYETTGYTVLLSDGETATMTIPLPMKPKEVKSAKFPDYDKLPDHLKTVLGESVNVWKDCEDPNAGTYGSLQGKDLYQQMGQISKAGMLNICAKMMDVKFKNGKDVFSYINSITRVQGDRFYALAEEEIKTAASDGLKSFHPDFDAAHTPPSEYIRAGSYKTYEAYGNLQLTFFEGKDGSKYLVDIDIDDAQYLEHVGQYVSHKITHGRTDPYKIHEVLRIGQDIDPLYRLSVDAA